MPSLKPMSVRYQPNRPTRAVRIIKTDYIVFPDGTIGIFLYTNRGVIYLPPIVSEGRVIPVPLYARGLAKICPEVKPVPYGVLYTP